MVEPVELGLEVEDVTLEDELPGELALVGRGLEAGHVAQGAQGRATLGLNHGLDVDRGVGSGHGELHDKLVTLGVLARNGGGPPGVENIATSVGQLEDLRVTARVGLSVRHNLTVTLQALHGLVNLADVERPRSTRLLLEHLLEAVDTRGLLRDECQQCIANRHNSPFVVVTRWLS